MKNNDHPFEVFLKTFVPEAARKSRLLHKASWLLETTGAADAADIKAELDIEYRLLFHDPMVYQKLLTWDNDQALRDPILKRQLNVLIRAFKQNQIPKHLVEELACKEAALAQCYASFRPECDGHALSENDILDILKKESVPHLRKKAWEASKNIGDVWAAQILDVVTLRNKGAQALGYSDYFKMQLDLQEVDESWLFSTLEDLAARSESSYAATLATIEQVQAQRFGVERHELGPWAWSEPFGQSDPLDTLDLDTLVNGTDISATSENFYRQMDIDVTEILARSDMLERTGKNQHAFCVNIDRGRDVRTLNNVKQSIKWLETVLHELGHAVYELGYDENLPWLLREPPHMITTEAMALLAGRQAYRYNSLGVLLDNASTKEALRKKAEQSLRRRQLIFSRWVLVMTYFERELYRNPKQDLNRLWWQLVNKYQKIQPPQGRENKNDWAAKVHIGLAPVYYFSYLLGKMFASAIEETLKKEVGSQEMTSQKAGSLLQQKLFFPGNRMRWCELIAHVTGKPLSADAWIQQFKG